MILALASGELFAPGEATMTPGGTSLIERIGTTLHQFRYQGIEVAGHTDNKPVRNDPRRTFHDNVQLSQARAEHASQALINSGLDANRVKAVGYAATKPIASNDSEKGRSKNRRVEIIVTPESGAVGPSGAKDKEGRRKSPVASHQKKRVMEKVLNR
jgi:flagellar motor protein MotB